MTTPDEMLEALRRQVTVQTTKPRRIELNAREKTPRPITLRESRTIDREGMWAFTDGSGSGWHAAVLVAPDRTRRLLARYQPAPSHSVRAEFNGILLALEEAPAREPLTIVSDFLWNIYYILGWRNVFDEHLVERTATARLLLREKAFPSVLFIYHEGHQKDASDFSRLNNVADRLCRAKQTCDRVEPPAD